LINYLRSSAADIQDVTIARAAVIIELGLFTTAIVLAIALALLAVVVS
jgi:hypothetical protein